MVRSFDADSYSEDGRSSTGNESRQSATLKAIVSFIQPLSRFTESAQNLINMGREFARRPRFAPDDPSVYMKLNAVVRLDGVPEITPTTADQRKDDPSLPKPGVGAPVGAVAEAEAVAWAGTRPERMLPFEEAPVRGGHRVDGSKLRAPSCSPGRSGVPRRSRCSVPCGTRGSWPGRLHGSGAQFEGGGSLCPGTDAR